ncbi:hypothetical protein KAH81_06095 [bacterium]|nr:hypothetical protein [bacterium]
MHLPKVRVLALYMAITWALLSLSGCVQESTAPAVPTGVQVTDIPADDGTNIVLAWRHYKASIAKQYQVYYSVAKDSLENEDLTDELTPLTRSVQVAVTTQIDTIADNVCDLDYYIVLDNPSSENPGVSLVKATSENRDSLASIGEKVLQVESELAPLDQDSKKIVFAQGNFYRIQLPDNAEETIKTTIENATLATDSTGLTIVEGNNSLIFEVGMAPEEKAFREAGERILEFDPSMSEYFFKYGNKIVAIVTEDKRYTLDFDVVQTIIRGTIDPGTNYFYKIVAKDGKSSSSTEIMEFTAVDEPPVPASDISARFDSERGEVFFSWMGYMPSLGAFKDIHDYSIHRYSPSDSTMDAGEVVGTYAPDFGNAIIKGTFSEDDMFYIATRDNSEHRTVSEPFALVVDKFSPPALIEPLDVVDVKNDDGSALSIHWGVPQIALDIVITDPLPQFEDREIPANYYLIPTETGHKLTQFEPGDSLIPPSASPVLGIQQTEIADRFDVTASYRMYVNDDHDVFYAKLKLDDGKFVNDFNNVGSFIFQGLEAGEHTFEAVLLNSAGKDLENPDARISRTLIVDHPGAFRSEKDEEYIEIWRGNTEIKKDEDILLDGVPGFDPENKYTFQLFGMAELIDKQLKDSYPDSLRDKGEYYYFVREIGPDGSFSDSKIFGPITPRSQFFHSEKSMVLALVILFIAFVNIFLHLARKGQNFYLRPIAGIAHLDEALGRATEMGRPILYVLGLTGISDIATLAGLTILGRVAKKSAEFQTRILVPCVDPIVMIVAQETVKTACMDAGRPDMYNEDDVFYAAGSQFSYAAAVAGLMVRHKTAANFYMGMFFAESLILTETGSMTGSIQIAGTDAVTQIPFFITTCDYTLIGEELYAASAYLSKDPLQVGTLKAQDMLKVIYMLLIVLGTVAMTTGFMWFVNLFKIRLEQ